VSGFFFLLVLLFLGRAVLRRRRGGSQERRLDTSLAVWAGLIVLGLFALTTASYFTDRGLALANTDSSHFGSR